jgi:ABC-type multidrug transport system fused ATPase/permease subunit
MNAISLAWRAAAGFRRSIAGVALLGFIVALLESATLLALFAFVASLASMHSSTTASPATAVTGLLGSLSVIEQAGLILIAATVRYVLSLVLEAKMSTLWVAIRAFMQRSMFEAHLNAAYPYLLSRKAGDHVYQIMEGPSFAAVFFLHLARFASTGILLVVLFLTLLYVSAFLMLAAGGVALIYGAVIRRVSVKVSYESGQRQSAAIRRQSQLVSEGLAGIRYLKALGAVPAWMSSFASETRIAEAAMGRAGFWNTVPARTLEYLVLVVFLGTVLYAVLAKNNLIAALPTVTVYFLGIVRILPALAVLGSGRMQMMQALPSLEQFVQLRDSITREPLHTGSEDVPDLREHAVVFADVTFSYPGNTVLLGLTCSLEPRRITAIVGQSGQGKSTLIDLLLRLIEPSGGRIKVNDRPIGGFALAEWRKRIAYVGQDSFLFHASIMDNLRLGRLDATDAEVMSAAELVGATEFIVQLPQGWSTVLADRGQSLSGGQRQRIVLARALLSSAEVLVLDEPTSALDSESENRVLAAILGARGNRTILLVTHSREAVRLSDKILLLEAGRITESGSYDELVTSGPRFRQIFAGETMHG